jgi:hypothetical protein
MNSMTLVKMNANIWRCLTTVLVVSVAVGCGDDDGGTNTGNDSGTTACGNGQRKGVRRRQIIWNRPRVPLS